ncbi:Gfo/Idh/MocA family protein [Segnochrobactrum spirostomi]|uniref:Gfo/Idh/MocA family oxidoreductase n=1 Tax=Segnochrobactrum spirostomi TaxID=2608987 RepID=A0A6A7Y9B4_9HYPH|nr:Gfo/Idh/MocA family oxidoreductase [Segnochrobactrum spirostomi]MQT14957.1 Gfo/Idh/MocA family oxidoreductase [Segnochrobactrum spirostomi]
MTAPLKGAVIGCGFFAQNHFAGWRDVAGAEIVAVCDLDRARAEAAARTFAAPPRIYTDAAALFAAEALDFVDIPTTMETHEALVGLAVSHRVPVIVQKPFGPNLAACRRMAAAADAAGVPLMVHEDFRFQPLFRRLKALLTAGEIGQPTFARLSWRTAIDVYSNQPYLVHTERFMIMDVGVHMIDLARFLLGEAESVFCRTQQIKQGIAGEDAATILLGHRGGATGIIDLSYAAHRDPDPFPQTLGEIEGEAGSILILPGEELVIKGRGGSRRERIAHDGRPWTSEPWRQIQDSVVRTQQHFVDALRAGTEPETSARDSLGTYAVVEAAYASAATGRAIDPATL